MVSPVSIICALKRMRADVLVPPLPSLCSTSATVLAAVPGRGVVAEQVEHVHDHAVGLHGGVALAGDGAGKRLRDHEAAADAVGQRQQQHHAMVSFARNFIRSYLQPVADLVHGQQSVFPADLFAQPLDVQVHGLAAVAVFAAPDVLVDRLAVERGAGLRAKNSSRSYSLCVRLISSVPRQTCMARVSMRSPPISITASVLL